MKRAQGCLPLTIALALLVPLSGVYFGGGSGTWNQKGAVTITGKEGYGMQIAIHCAGMGCGLHSPLRVALPGVLFSGGGSGTWNQHGAIAITAVSGYGMCAAGSMHCADTQGGGTAKCADGCLLLTIKLILPPPHSGVYFDAGSGTWNQNGTVSLTVGFFGYGTCAFGHALQSCTAALGDFVLSPPPSPFRGAFWCWQRNMDPKWHCHHHHHGIRYDVRCRANAVRRHIWLLVTHRCVGPPLFRSVFF